MMNLIEEYPYKGPEHVWFDPIEERILITCGDHCIWFLEEMFWRMSLKKNGSYRVVRNRKRIHARLEKDGCEYLGEL
jgi:hypothetical protein